MSEARELDLALMMADLCGYTALTQTHGAVQASETVLRFALGGKSPLHDGDSETRPAVWLAGRAGDAPEHSRAFRCCMLPAKEHHPCMN